MKTGASEIDPNNVQVITRDQLKDTDKAEFEAHMRHYEEFCLASYNQTKNGIFKKSLLPTPKKVTFSADHESLQDMMTKVMHQTMIDQAKVFANTVQNNLIEALKKGAEGGYLGPAYFQPNRTLPMFQQDQSAIPPIDDSTVKITRLHKLLLVLHQTPSRFRIKVVMVKLKTLPSQCQYNLTSRIRCSQYRIKNIPR
jgi:hypothetical protein